ncbi:6113_t:CDS:2, partial [Acaulospora morrowiae]
ESFKDSNGTQNDHLKCQNLRCQLSIAQTKASAAESKISDLESKLSVAEEKITGLKSKLSNAESNYHITLLENNKLFSKVNELQYENLCQRASREGTPITHESVSAAVACSWRGEPENMVEHYEDIAKEVNRIYNLKFPKPTSPQKGSGVRQPQRRSNDNALTHNCYYSHECTTYSVSIDIGHSIFTLNRPSVCSTMPLSNSYSPTYLVDISYAIIISYSFLNTASFNYMDEVTQNERDFATAAHA